MIVRRRIRGAARGPAERVGADRGAALRRIARRGNAERGTAVAEFVMVGALLTGLTLAVLQLALALHIRNTVLDAAAEGARYAALADSGLGQGAKRSRDLITAALGPDYAAHVTADFATVAGQPGVRVRVVAPLPLFGLLGVTDGLEVEGHAVVEGSVGG